MLFAIVCWAARGLVLAEGGDLPTYILVRLKLERFQRFGFRFKTDLIREHLGEPQARLKIRKSM